MTQQIIRNSLTIAIFFCFGILSINGQNTDGYIMQINGDNIYLNVPNVKVGDVLSVMSGGGYITDPRTGQQIKTEPEVVGQIKVIKVTASYSIGKAYGNTDIHQLADAMTVRKAILQTNNYGETTVMVAPAEVHLPQGVNTMVSSANGEQGYIGDVVSAELMSHLLKCSKITVIDRFSTTLQTQQQELGLAQQDEIIDPNTALQLGKMSGARYMVKITLQKPDVEIIQNNISTGGIIDIANANSNTYNPQRQQLLQQARNVAPDIKTTNIQVKVKIYTHIVDLQTGRTLFACNSEGNAKGNPQIQLEYAQLGANFDINQGANFTQSTTGKAIEDAFKKIGKELRQYFEKNL